MSLEYSRAALRVCVAQICQNLGWHAIQSTPLEMLTDILERYLLEIGRTTHRYSEQFGRTHANLNDLSLTFGHMGIVLSELDDYYNHIDPMPFPGDVVQFPAPKESDLQFPNPRSREIMHERPEHVPDYLPYMYPGMEEEVDAEGKPIEATTSEMTVDVEDDAPHTPVAARIGLMDKPATPTLDGSGLKRPRMVNSVALPEEAGHSQHIPTVTMDSSGRIVCNHGDGRLPTATAAPVMLKQTLEMPSDMKKRDHDEEDSSMNELHTDDLEDVVVVEKQHDVVKHKKMTKESMKSGKKISSQKKKKMAKLLAKTGGKFAKGKVTAAGKGNWLKDMMARYSKGKKDADNPDIPDKVMTSEGTQMDISDLDVEYDKVKTEREGRLARYDDCIDSVIRSTDSEVNDKRGKISKAERLKKMKLKKDQKRRKKFTLKSMELKPERTTPVELRVFDFPADSPEEPGSKPIKPLRVASPERRLSEDRLFEADIPTYVAKIPSKMTKNDRSGPDVVAKSSSDKKEKDIEKIKSDIVSDVGSLKRDGSRDKITEKSHDRIKGDKNESSSKNESSRTKNESSQSKTESKTESSRDKIESSREKNESSREKNESSHNKNESSHNKNESSHNKNESSRDKSSSKNESSKFESSKIKIKSLDAENESSRDSYSSIRDKESSKDRREKGKDYREKSKKDRQKDRERKHDKKDKHRDKEKKKSRDHERRKDHYRPSLNTKVPILKLKFSGEELTVNSPANSPAHTPTTKPDHPRITFKPMKPLEEKNKSSDSKPDDKPKESKSSAAPSPPPMKKQRSNDKILPKSTLTISTKKSDESNQLIKSTKESKRRRSPSLSSSETDSQKTTHRSPSPPALIRHRSPSPPHLIKQADYKSKPREGLNLDELVKKSDPKTTKKFDVKIEPSGAIKLELSKQEVKSAETSGTSDDQLSPVKRKPGRPPKKRLSVNMAREENEETFNKDEILLSPVTVDIPRLSPRRFEKVKEDLPPIPPPSRPQPVQRAVFCETVVETHVEETDESGEKVWICPGCKEADDGSPMIGCDICDDWYHWPCVRITEEPDDDQWYCPRCVGRPMPSPIATAKPGRGRGRGRGKKKRKL